MCHAPAEIFRIKERGFISEGYFADLVIVDLNNKWTVSNKNILYKCKWSPFENQDFRSKVIYTIINGNLVYDNTDGKNDTGRFYEDFKGERLTFRR